MCLLCCVFVWVFDTDAVSIKLLPKPLITPYNIAVLMASLAYKDHLKKAYPYLNHMNNFLTILSVMKGV